MIKESRETLPLLALARAFIFVLSSLKMLSITGSWTPLDPTEILK